jgi:hypothetical protein
MAIFKKKDGKPMAKSSAPAPKRGATLTRSVKTVMKSAAPDSKLGLGSVAKRLKAQGEMKTKMSPSKSSSSTTKPFSKNAQKIGHEAAEASRSDGRRAGALSNAVDVAAQKLLNAVGTKGDKRSKSGGVIDMGDPGFRGRYSGLTNAQMDGKKKK